MSKKSLIGTHKTTVITEGNKVIVRYHNTNVVEFDENIILLNTGGYLTKTTKLRMNQTSEEFNLGFKVYAKDRVFYVDYKNKTYEFVNRTITLDRKGNS